MVIGARDPLAEILVQRLVGDGDQVRVIEEDADAAKKWRALGAHVAAGVADDADLVERAAQNVRTLVAVDAQLSTIDALIQGAKLASVGRIVLCGTKFEAGALDALRSSGLDFVALKSRGKLGAFLRGTGRRIPPAAMAAAISAADDLAGNPKLELDLTKQESWAQLNLSPP